MDIVIPKEAKCEWGNHEELRYCLRSIEKNVSDLGRVFIIGYKPDWLQNVVHLEWEDYLKRNKDGNLINKVLLACRSGVSEQFLRMSDDQLILKPLAISEQVPMHSGDLSEKEIEEKTRWRNRLKRTVEYLKDNGHTCYSFDYHIPQPYDRRQFKEVFEKVDFEADIGYCINTFYFNQQNKFTNFYYICNNVKESFERRHNFSLPQIEEKIKDKRYLGYNPKGLNDNLKTVIQQKFPNKSSFER